MNKIRAWAAQGAQQNLTFFTHDAGELGPEEIEVAVEHCGLCHSDLSMINNDWGLSQVSCYPRA